MFKKFGSKKVLLGLVGLMFVATSLWAKDTRTVVDVAGRKVEIPKKVTRVILGESRMIYALAPIMGKRTNPIKFVVGWKDDLELYDPDAYEKYLAKFPSIAKIKNLGSPYKGDFNIETAIALKTQLIIMNLGNYFKAKETGAIEKLEKAGIATVFVDFRQQPSKNTVPSILLLGKIFKKSKNALKLIDFYVEQMQLVYGRVANKKDSEKPLVFIESAAASGWGDCCSTFGDMNMGRFVALAGGKNWGSQLFSGFKGKVNPEKIFSTNPPVIIGTGANWSKAKPETKAVLLGYEATEKEVQKRLHNLANRKGWSSLDAVKNKRFYSVYHQFYNSPYHFVAIQFFAKAFYPNEFSDVNPVKTFKTFHKKFLPVKYSGVFFSKLK